MCLHAPHASCLTRRAPLAQGYTDEHVDTALRTLPRGVGHVTFPVHCTMARVGSEAVVRLLEADPRFTLTFWGEASEADDAWMRATPQLQGRYFRDCAKPGALTPPRPLPPVLTGRVSSLFPY
jgi:hypothetical protein